MLTIRQFMKPFLQVSIDNLKEERNTLPTVGEQVSILNDFVLACEAVLIYGIQPRDVYHTLKHKMDLEASNLVDFFLYQYECHNEE